MTFPEFEDRVDEMLAEIPPAFLRGLQGVHTLPDLRADPRDPGTVQLGEYMDPGPESLLSGSNPFARHISLFYGSFAWLAARDPWFDWDEEVWETLTHEIRHHIESLAGDVSLIQWDREQKEARERYRAHRGDR
ncbi:MAG TPA: metallopeptidase family protein [Deinococcales bacterium]|nr:metallopeptidase family protein [Deinococcales bacterium]